MSYFNRWSEILLDAAIDDFADICVQDLTNLDDELEQFNIEFVAKRAEYNRRCKYDCTLA